MESFKVALHAIVGLQIVTIFSLIAAAPFLYGIAFLGSLLGEVNSIWIILGGGCIFPLGLVALYFFSTFSIPVGGRMTVQFLNGILGSGKIEDNKDAGVVIDQLKASILDFCRLLRLDHDKT